MCIVKFNLTVVYFDISYKKNILNFFQAILRFYPEPPQVHTTMYFVETERSHL
jgi:hypothetical protein